MKFPGSHLNSQKGVVSPGPGKKCSARLQILGSHGVAIAHEVESMAANDSREQVSRTWRACLALQEGVPAGEET
jgi:hypothetical protein